MKVESRPMTTAEMQKGTEDIGKAVKAVGGSGTKKGSLFDSKQLKGAKNALKGVGSIIKGIRKFRPDPINPMVRSLQTLQDKLKQIDDQMSANFEEMKSFISEIKFFVKIFSPTSVLTKYMRDCVKHPGPESVECFRRIYHQFSPLKLTYTIVSFLKQKSTNPIRLAMNIPNSDPRKAYDKWEDIIHKILEQLMMLEAFATGLFGLKTDTNCDQMIEGANEVIQALWQFREECSEKCWEEMKKFMWNYHTGREKMTNNDKVWEVKNKLEEYLTNDAYFIIAMKGGYCGSTYNFKGPNLDSQLIQWFAMEGVGIHVYRSRKANEMKEIDYENSEKAIDVCRNTEFFYSGEYTNTVIQEQLLDKDIVRSDGYILLVNMSCEPEVKWVEPPNHKRAPGSFDKVHVVRRDTGHEETYLLLVGLP